MATNLNLPNGGEKAALHPFRKAVLRGMGVVVPPLFTILIFLWVINSIDQHVLNPVTGWAREGVVWVKEDIRTNVDSSDSTVTLDGRLYQRMENGTFVPHEIYDQVRKKQGEQPMPTTGKDLYRRWVDLTILRPWIAIPFFLSLFVLLLYLLGKFMAAGIGRFFWHRFELGIHRLPLIRNVYSSVKQISDFLFTEREIEYTRVVAVEYPRKGIWSLGLVTGESMLDICSAANEPVLSVLMPTSPMPVTGFTVTVLKSETVDLNITIDQAFQFIVSCGVVVPPHQMHQMASDASKPPALSAPDHSAGAEPC